MTDCLFCKIVNGEIPAHKVYEDKDVLAFLEINPDNSGHTLVISKNHSENLLDTSGEDLRTLISIIPKIAKGVCESLDYKGFNLLVNNGSVAGQLVPHLHFHIIPRKEDDGHEHFVGEPYQDGEIEQVAEKIRKILK
ncbi:HIT family protein [Candidatus Kuenenbacteria bacterium]|nr:HIT family protein [Candidatus Kuenenbacteria bacterium]